jgi:hypothetical protein
MPCSAVVAAFEIPALETKMSKRSPTRSRHMSCECSGAFGRRQVRAHSIGLATSCAYFRNESVGIRGRAATMDNHVGALLRESLSSRASNTARSSSDQRRFVYETAHDAYFL